MSATMASDGCLVTYFLACSHSCQTRLFITQ